MAADEWHDNGPQDLVKISLCIQIAIDKMKLCSLSVVYACMGHAVHNIDISKPLPGTVETGIHPWRAHFSSVPVAIKGENFPTEVSYDATLQSGQDPSEDDELLTGCTEMIWLCKLTVSSPVRVAGLRRSHRWRSQMWWSWAGWTYCQIL